MTKVSKVLSAIALAAVVLPSLAFADNGNVNGNMSLHSNVNATVKRKSVTGIVASVSGMTIMLTAKNASSTVYSVDATNAKLVRRYGASMQITDIQTGDMLQVQGTVTGTSVTASAVRDLSLQQRNGSFVGTITAINGSSFTLNSKARGDQTINLTSTTVYRLGDKAASSTALAVGETVTVNGVWDRTNKNVTAKRVTIKMTGINVTGMLQSINGTMLTVNASSTTYSVDAAKARIAYKNGKKADITLLQTGDQVRVQGKVITGITNITANYVSDLSKTSVRSTSTASSTLEH